MQTQLVIDKGGVTGAATKDTPPRGGVLVIRSRKRYVVTLAADISCVALVALLSTLRAINSPIELVVGGETFHFATSRELCLDIVKRALSACEADESSPFSSQIEIANSSLLSVEETPEPLLTLCRFSSAGMDTLSALLAVNQLNIDDLCLIGLNRAMDYCFLKVPTGVC